MSTLEIDDSRNDRIHVRLNRPEVKNAIDRVMVGELHDVCALLEAQPRILIVSGADGVFASGRRFAELGLLVVELAVGRPGRGGQ